MVTYLAQPGAEDVSLKFDRVINFGLLSNVIYLLFQIFKMRMARRGKHTIDASVVCVEICVAAVWVTQFCMLISYRFAHTGQVCSGDFAEDQLIRSVNMNDKVMKPQIDKYNQYYVSKEGDFLYYYVSVCVALFLFFFLFACCTGSCLFFVGSTASLTMVEAALKEVDKIPEMMRQKAGGGAGGPQQRPNNDDPFARGPADDESAFRDQFKND